MYRIIIADDEVIECRALEMMIRNDFPDMEILPYVQNGIDLIASVEKNHPDIAIIDINMPGLNGLDALEIIRLRPSLLTAYPCSSGSPRPILCSIPSRT